MEVCTMKRLLHYFVTVVEQGTYTKAAEMLHISQPSLSAAIKKLENHYDLKLIDRTTREMKLTQEGKVLYEEAKKLITHFDHVTEEMHRLKVEGPLELQIGLIESAKFWIPSIIAKFKKEYPHIYIKLLEILSLEDVEQSLFNFDIHFVITSQLIDHPNIETYPIYEENLVALIPLSHPLHKVEEISTADFENEPLIICKEGFQTREDTLIFFRKSGIKPNIQFEIERFETACSLVENGLGITLVPENYVTFDKKREFHIRQIAHHPITRIVYIAYVKNRYLPPLVRDFIRLVREVGE